MEVRLDQARRDYVICRAIYLALCTLQRLPEDRRPQADWDDMVALMNLPPYSQLIDTVVKAQDELPPAPILKLFEERPLPLPEDLS